MPSSSDTDRKEYPGKVFDVSCAGHLCLDITPEFRETGKKRAIEDIIKPGALVQAGPADVSTGGSVSNTGTGLKVIGFEVAFIALAGKDLLGELMLSLLKRHGSTEGITLTDSSGTSYSVVVAPPGIDRTFIHYSGTNDLFCSEHIDYGIVAGSRIFHLGYPTVMEALFCDNGRELKEIFRRVKALGVTTSLDLTLPDPRSEAGRVDWRRIFPGLLPYVDCFLPSIEESYFCMYPERYLALREKVRGELIDHIESEVFETLGREFIDLGCGLCMLKAGHQGLYLRTGSAERLAEFGRCGPRSPDEWAGRELWCPVFETERIASTTGSGDAAIAGLLSGLLKGLSVDKSLKMAALNGYLNLQAVDPFSGLKSFSECEVLLTRGSSSLRVGKLERDLGPGWEYDRETGIYHKV